MNTQNLEISHPLISPQDSAEEVMKEDDDDEEEDEETSSGETDSDDESDEEFGPSDEDSDEREERLADLAVRRRKAKYLKDCQEREQKALQAIRVAAEMRRRADEASVNISKLKTLTPRERQVLTNVFLPPTNY